MYSSFEFVSAIKLLSSKIINKYKQISTINKQIKNLTFLLICKCYRLFLYSIKLRTIKISKFIQDIKSNFKK